MHFGFDKEVGIVRVERGSRIEGDLLRFVEDCSWTEAKEHIAQLIRTRAFTDWETMFAAVRDGRIVGMASAMKTDYYPLPDVFPWISCLFVSEEERGRGVSGRLVAFAERYLCERGFRKAHIPCAFSGLYERYGYRLEGEITNYGGGTDLLYVKELFE